MLLAKYKNSFGEMVDKLYTFDTDFFRDTFSPDIEILTIIFFEISGKTYKERKNNLQFLAISFSNQSWEGLYYSDLQDITEWFGMNAKKYGLTKEFKENGII